ncbi:MAG: hypothetical protein LQ342_006234 [Letrouitia transgressa]|nr:MAG: hypothetical protein LQ342_006234 [Letrouitia transgressa]
MGRIIADGNDKDKDKYADFAVKEFTDRPKRVSSDFERELKILDELRKYPLERVVTHRASWTQDGKYYMLFSYAQCNLRQYMKRYSFVAETKSWLWLLDQFRGLAHAIRDIHNLSTTSNMVSSSNLAAPNSGMRTSGWHHDLKPANILLFPPKSQETNEAAIFGDLWIADFGSGKVNTYRSGSINTRSPNGTLTYEPPEIISEGTTSRPYDVWSLGCVFLELLIWAIFGDKGVRQFRRERHARRHPYSETIVVLDDAFWQVGPDDKPIVRQPVAKWVTKVRQALDENSSYPFKEVLDLVSPMPAPDGMFGPDRQIMLDPNRHSRISALNLWETLDRIFNQKKVDLQSSDIETRNSSLPRLYLNPPNRPRSDSFSSVSSETSDRKITDGDLTSSPMESLSPRSSRLAHR